MKVSEFRKPVKNVPEECNNLELYITDPNPNEYCMGPDVIPISDIDLWKRFLETQIKRNPTHTIYGEIDI